MKAKRGVMIAVGLLGIASLTGCYATISTPSGLREHHRGLNGLVTTGKSAPNKLDEYHKTQRFDEEQKTLRIRFNSATGEE